jgi:hypothetical protein
MPKAANAPRYTDEQLDEYRALADPTTGKLDLRHASHRHTPGTFEVATAPLYPGDAYDPNGEQIILVDGRQIGGTYTGGTGWGCWGPAGWSWSHPTHQAAVDVQVRAYAIDPDSQDRVLDTALATEATEREQEAAYWVEARRRHAEKRAQREQANTEPPVEQRVAAAPEADDLPEWWEIDTGAGTMLCGYCHETISWAYSVLGYERLTGNHLLGVHRDTGRLVVLAEATALSGDTTYLPHHCEAISAELTETYAADIAAAGNSLAPSA